MRSVIVIPARYRSSRLPGKPLLRHTGKYLIQHVYEQAQQAKLADDVIVATDDPRIMAAVDLFGGKAVMTSRNHATGTDRVAEVARNLDADIIVNLQGDEPLIDPAELDRVIGLLRDDESAEVATLAVPIRSEEEYRDPNVVKVVLDWSGRAMYFSRSPVPMVRDEAPNFEADPPLVLRHVGLYAYRRASLLKLAQMPPTPIEDCEKLEQLRVLHVGWSIKVGLTQSAAPGVDTWDDYLAFVRDYQTMQRPARLVA